MFFSMFFLKDFCLDGFPFDCQRLKAELQLLNEGFKLVPHFCTAGDRAFRVERRPVSAPN